MPPSTRKVEAVMNEASSLARNATADAISSGSANRPSARAPADAGRAARHARHHHPALTLTGSA
jgi:hypothetical protein